MMRWNGLGRSLLFGAFAAAAFIPFAIIATPLFGWSGAVAAYAIVSAAVYLSGLGPTLRQGLAASLLLGLGVGAIAVVAPSHRDVVLAAALALGVLRSGLLYRSRFARALAIESALGCGGLLIAGQIFDGSVVSTALAVWAFYLVQSVFFAVGGITLRCDRPDDVDPFEAARARALALLDDVGVGDSG
jgi:hypothetical protein